MRANTLLAQLRGLLRGLPRNYDASEAATTSVFVTANEVLWLPLREGGSLSAVRCLISTSNGNLCIALARNTGRGTSAQPGALIATTGSVASPGTGSRDFALPSKTTVNAGDWIGIAVDNTTISLRCRTTASYADSTLAAGQSYRETISSGGPAIPASRGTLTASIHRSPILIGV